MSEFDKEAERRRLREKYESEAEDRETTERMSQLLLQGATMTNHHCDHCGTPIFRYQGQEFCPTCQAESQAAVDAEADASNDTAAAQHADGGAQGETTAAEAPTPRQDTTPSVPQREETALQPDDTTDQLPDVAGEEAADALASTIATLAARAEQTDDPRRAREFLEAAHEAAETLATLRR